MEAAHESQTTEEWTIMKRSRRMKVPGAVIAAAMILGVSLLLMAASVPAAEPEGKQAVQFNVNLTMADNLVALKGRTVTVTLSSGQAVTGIVSDVKGNLLHLTKLSQKDFYDALVAVDRICAIETKVR